VGYAAAWLVAAVPAVLVGLVAVTSVGASLRDRGPIGEDAALYVREADRVEGAATPDPDDPVVRQEFPGDYGTFVVECRGPFATAVALRPAPGWRRVALERGPDDDLDAVLATTGSTGGREVTLEVFCDQGRPALADREVRSRGTAADAS